LSFSEFCDIAWTFLARSPGGFTNPFEYREMMKALVGYSDKTVEQVMAENKQRSDGKSKKEPKAAGAEAPAPTEMAKLQALLAAAKPRPRPTTE